LVQSERKSRVGAEVPGRIVSRKVDRGSVVRKGQLLIQLDDSKLLLERARVQASVDAARTQAAFAAAELARAEALGDALASSALDQARRADDLAGEAFDQTAIALATIDRTLQDTRITAPFAGIVADRYAEVGDIVAPGMPLLSLVTVDPILVQVGVSAAEAARLKPGSAAQVVFADVGGRTGEAELLAVGRVPDPLTGTYLAEFRVANPNGDLREGMVAHVTDTSEPTRALLIPRAALIDHDGGPAVFVVVAGTPDVARVRAVQLGRQDPTRVEVVSGLVVGERVVVAGQFALAEGIAVTVEGG
jgi:RND family efflux transporter MFP subunit